MIQDLWRLMTDGLGRAGGYSLLLRALASQENIGKTWKTNVWHLEHALIDFS